MSATIIEPNQSHETRAPETARDSPASQRGDNNPLNPTGPHPAARSWGDFLRAYFGPYWKRLAVLAALLTSGVALQTLGPLLTQRFIDAQAAHAAETALIALALGSLAAAIFNTAFSLHRGLSGPGYRLGGHQPYPRRPGLLAAAAGYALPQRAHAGRADRAH